MTGRRKAVIFDADGTLVDVRHIRYLIEDQGFEAFHRASTDCPPHEDVVEAAQSAHEAGLIVLVFTARMERYRDLTEEWLQRYHIPYAQVFMRPEGDYRKDFAVKRDMYISASLVYDITHAWDDQPAIIDLWTSLDVPVTKVPGWEEPGWEEPFMQGS